MDAHSRRTFLRGAVALASTGSVLAAGPEKTDRPRLIVRSTRPLDAESPVEAFEEFLTPNELFFVRSHFGPPAILGPWTLEIRGAVERPKTLSLTDLKLFRESTIAAVLQCSGNGRAYYRPVVPGVGWERGAVGNAEWTGVRLVDVLEAAGIRPSAQHVHLLGADNPPSPKTPPFFRSIPLDQARHPTTLLATRMNGQPVPLEHGGPLRLVVPTWAGHNWIKWLRVITLDAAEAPGFYMEKGYRMPRKPYPPGQEPPAADLEPLTAMNVKSLFARPADGTRVTAGPAQARGVAWTGEGAVERVEVAIDDGGWKPAELLDEPEPGTWRRWRFAWIAEHGRHTLKVRATDSRGNVQPDAPPWNKSGYLWNGIDTVRVEV